MPSEAEWELPREIAVKTSPTPGAEASIVHEQKRKHSALRFDTVPVCSLNDGISPAGFVIAGNVWETMADDWHPSYMDAPVDGSPLWLDEPRTDSRVHRGGSFFQDASKLRATTRGPELATATGGAVNDYGFRLARGYTLPAPGKWILDLGEAHRRCTKLASLRRQRSIHRRFCEYLAHPCQ